MSVRPHGHGSGSTATRSVTSNRISGWVMLKRFVTSSREPTSPGGTGLWSSSTFSTMHMSSKRCMEPAGQSWPYSPSVVP